MSQANPNLLNYVSLVAVESDVKDGIFRRRFSHLCRRREPGDPTCIDGIVAILLAAVPAILIADEFKFGRVSFSQFNFSMLLEGLFFAVLVWSGFWFIYNDVSRKWAGSFEIIADPLHLTLMKSGKELATLARENIADIWIERRVILFQKNHEWIFCILTTHNQIIDFTLLAPGSADADAVESDLRGILNITGMADRKSARKRPRLELE